MSQKNDSLDLEARLRELREWIRANSRRIEELEATAFRLQDVEEVLVIAVTSEENLRRER